MHKILKTTSQHLIFTLLSSVHHKNTKNENEPLSILTEYFVSVRININCRGTSKWQIGKKISRPFEQSFRGLPLYIVLLVETWSKEKNQCR